MLRTVLAHYGDIEEWRLGDAARAALKGYPRLYDAPLIDDFGIVFVDLVVERDSGALRCHEVNRPNAVGSDALTGDSLARAENEARQAVRRIREFGYLQPDGMLNTSVVSLHAHQHWKFFRTGGEFYPRVLDFAGVLEAMLPGNRVEIRAPEESLGGERITVLSGDVPAIAAGIEFDPESGGLTYQGRPVVFAGNPNLLPELVRTKKLARRGMGFDCADLRIFHAWRLLPVFQDRTRQQALLRGTGIEPMPSFEAMTIEEALAASKNMLGTGPLVLKPNGGSGGAGIRIVVPGMSDLEIHERINAVIGDCVAKYGANAESTAFPIRGFPFIRSTLYPMPDGGHTWDLRIAVLFEPGKAGAYPVSLRIAPDPFDPEDYYNLRDQWLSNVSGRQVTLRKSGMDDAALAAVGFTDEKLEQAMAASVAWCVKAWDRASRDGGGIAVYEDACEEDDAAFYPWQKFSA